MEELNKKLLEVSAERDQSLADSKLQTSPLLSTSLPHDWRQGNNGDKESLQKDLEHFRQAFKLSTLKIQQKDKGS
jgi:hypothetical protein